jgi:hypothetical protein
MKVPIQDNLFLYTGARGMGGLYCSPSHFEWDGVATGTPARFYTDLCMRDAMNHPHPRVGWLVEAPPYAQCHYDWAVEHEAEFDCILTPCQTYADRGGPWRWYPHGGSHIPYQEWDVSRRKIRSGISFLASNKTDASGHKMRHAIYERFGYLHTFGSILNGAFTGKVEALAPYRYSVVVEGERNAGCFSDHLLDCLALQTIPLYWGCPDIGRWFDLNGILPFETLGELEDLLVWPSKEDYDARFNAGHIQRNLEMARRYRVPEDWLWENCRDLFGGLE